MATIDSRDGLQTGWDPFLEYEFLLRNSDQDKLTVRKTASDAAYLPSRFVRSGPARAMFEAGYVASYRDDRRENSLHVIEYTDRWEMHLDKHNPRYPRKQILHLVDDAPEVALAFAGCCAVVALALAARMSG